MYLTLETERLLIRPINLDDNRFILELVNTEGWLRFIGDRNVLDEKDAEEYIQKILDSTNFYYSVFELKKLRKSIGMVSLRKREDEQYPDIGFALLPDFEQKGYALEACKSYLDKIRTSDKYDNIIAITIPDNKKSIALLRKLGLHYKRDRLKDGNTLSYFSLNQNNHLF